MNINWEPIIQTVVVALVPIILELLTGILRTLVQYLRTIIQGKIMEQAVQIVADAVINIEETAKADLLKAKADGKITAEEGRALAAHAAQIAMADLSKLPAALLKAVIPELESWVRRQIEVQLGKLKLVQGPQSLPPAGGQAAAPSPAR